MNTVPIQNYTPGRRGRKGPSFGKKRRFPPAFSGSALKLFAVFSMTADHVGAALIERGILKSGNPRLMGQILATQAGTYWKNLDQVLRYAGRLAFPVFAFFLAEGFIHSRHRREYGLRLLIFALLSEAVFDLAFYDRWFYPRHQNVLFTFLIAYLTLWGIQKCGRRQALRLLCAGAGCAAGYLLKCDYGAVGVMLVVILYWFKGREDRLLAGAVIAAADSAASWCTAALAFIPLAFYSGERGKRPGKYFFYVFYPLHLLLLYLGRTLFLTG